ncbi:MAG: aromatic ring-hydroxylating dioxygenase subunit alpha [Aquisalimonadaceae bacterium]
MTRAEDLRDAAGEVEFVHEDLKVGTFRVHSGVYVENHVFDAEMEAFFRRGWVYLAHESQLPEPNDYLTCRLARQPILLSRGEDGEVRGFLNRCRHRGALVCRNESGNAKSFTCFYHSWSYRNTGELTGVTGPEGFPPNFDLSGLGLAPLPRLESYRGFLFGSLSADGPPLKEHLGNAAAYLDLILDKSDEPLRVVPGVSTYEFKGNWKLQAENSLDYYHLPFVHRSFMEVRRARGEEVKRGNLRNLANDYGVDLGNGHGTVITLDEGGEPNQHLFLFPNLVLLEEPAPQIRVIDPLAVDQTKVRGYFYMHGEADNSMKLRHYERFYGPTGFGTPDDMEVFHSCMDGYSIDSVPWNDLSRGLHREVTEAPLAWMPPFVSAGNITDDNFMRGFYRKWRLALSSDVRRPEPTA